MGTVAEGTLTVGGQKVNVKADFASDHVTFSGGRRGEVKYTKIEVLGTAKGRLRLRVDDAVMEFPLGDKVDRVAAKIRRPPSLLDKLGVKPGLAVATEGIQDATLRHALKEVPLARAGPVDVLLAGVSSVEELEAIPDWLRRVAPDGALWVVYPKARREIREADVLAAGRSFGLKDTKVARVSETRTALRFVRPADEG
jgi:hypothetical protein